MGKFHKLHKGQTIELSDLIPTIENDAEDEEHDEERHQKSVKDIVNLKQNLMSLDEIAKEKEQGLVFHSMDESAIDLMERKAANEIIQKEMKKWDPIVDYVDSARTVPLLKDNDEKLAPIIFRKREVPADDFDRILEDKMKQKKDMLEEIPEGEGFNFEKSDDEDEILTKEQMIQRTRELARKRRLISYQQQKLARLKKIKSKSYRKRLKKAKQQQEIKNENLAELDEDEIKEKLNAAEEEYIKERMTLKHKNKSKWIQRAIKHSKVNDDLKQAVSEQLSIGDSVKSRRDKLRDYLKKQKESVIGEMKQEGEEDEEIKEQNEEEEKGLFAMKFMKRSMQKRLEEAQEMNEEIEKELSGNGDDQELIFGRRRFEPESKKMASQIQNDNHEEDNSNLREILHSIQTDGIKRKRTTQDNPWLSVKHEREERQSKKQKKEKFESENSIQIKLDAQSLGLDEKKVEDEKDEKKEDEEESKFIQEVKQEAFAADDLELEFSEKKESVIDEELDLPDLKLKMMPGWGGWAGKGISNEKFKNQQKKLENVKQALRIQKANERPDKALDHVIIRASASVPEKFLNTKAIKSSTRKKIYDNVVSHPIGPEWNSTSGFQSIIKPRIQKVSGVAIRPMDYESFEHIPMRERRQQEGTGQREIKQ